MQNKILNDDDYGDRDKRNHWKPAGNVPVNPPYVLPFKPLKLIKHFFNYPGLIFPWQALFAKILT